MDFVSENRIRKFVGKAITCLSLLDKELNNGKIDLDLVYDYSREAQGYLNLVHKQIVALSRVGEATQGVVNGLALETLKNRHTLG